MKKIILLFLCLIAMISILNAQTGKLKKADDLYAKVAFHKASMLYTELVDTEVDSPELKSKLANCYYQIGQTQKAEEVYAKMINSSEATAEDYYNYAQSLKENGKYELSDEWMQKFVEKDAADKRGELFLKNKDYKSVIASQGIYFEIRNLDVNTQFSDFGGYPKGDSISYFVTNRRNRLFVKRSHSWNGNKFLDLYETEVGVNNELEKETFFSQKVNKKFHEGPICFNEDLSRVYYTRNNIKKFGKRRDENGIQNLKLYTSDVNADGEWVNEKEIPFNSKDYSVGHPTISSDGTTMYFASDMPGGYGGADLYKVSIAADGSIGTPENLGAEYNTEGQEMFPWMNDEGMLFFSSDGHAGLGGLDVFVMLVDAKGNPKKLMNVGGPLNSNKDDFAFTMNSDNQTGYFSSNRDNGKGDDDIYAYSLLKPLKLNLMVKGLITDVRTGDILPNSKVELLGKDGTTLAETLANEKGEYEFSIEPDTDYKLAVTKNDYFDNSEVFTTLNLPKGKEQIEQDVKLEKDPGIGLMALVSDGKTEEPIEGVKMIIVDNFTGEEFVNIVTPMSGNITKGLSGKKLDERISYNISLAKEGYFPKTVTFNHQITKPGIIEVHNVLAGGLKMDKEVKDLSELVKINPINFDLNKYKIRADAEVELDKIVEVMNKYPGMEVELGSHTDCRASRKYNESLSDKRAKASAAYIKTKISNPERIYGKGYGEERLLNDCFCEGKVKSTCTEEEHEKNRRTEFKVISTGSEDIKVENSSSNSFDNN